MSPIRYRPTGEGTPHPILVERLAEDQCNRWVSVTESLPPPRLNVLVMVRGDNCPAYGWLKFGAGDRTCPYFVVPQTAAMTPRGTHHGLPAKAQHRQDVTHWFSPTTQGLPGKPVHYEIADWGLCGCGWETVEEELNPWLH